MSAAPSEVFQLLACVPRERGTPAAVVKGLSLRHYKTLGLNPAESIDHKIFIRECTKANIPLGRMLLGTGITTLVRGICTGTNMPYTRTESDGDEDYSVSSQQE